jgi:RHS repeat-associated protein
LEAETQSTQDQSPVWYWIRKNDYPFLSRECAAIFPRTLGANPRFWRAYDGDNLIEETNPSGAVVSRYSQTQEIDEPLAMLRSSTTSYYHADGIGSINSLSNGAGALAQTYTFDSFGKQTASSGSLTNPFQFTGREFDTETNLQFSRARYYDPSAGRFLSQDPIGFNGGVTAYAYVQNNSPTFADPLGLKKTCTPLGDPLQITPWMKWADGPPIPIGGWQYAGTGPAGGEAESGANAIGCVSTRKVKQPISRYAYFVQEYRCVGSR